MNIINPKPKQAEKCRKCGRIINGGRGRINKSGLCSSCGNREREGKRKKVIKK